MERGGNDPAEVMAVLTLVLRARRRAWFLWADVEVIGEALRPVEAIPFGRLETWAQRPDRIGADNQIWS